MDRGAWWATVSRVIKNWTQLKQLSTKACMTFYFKRHAEFQTKWCGNINTFFCRTHSLERGISLRKNEKLSILCSFAKILV